MCGIAGLAGDYVAGLGARMNEIQGHRGPDGRGVFEDVEARCTLAHVRLAVLDLTQAAAQPMHSADGRFVIAFGGEIYNFRQLRQELAARGRRFHSTGDTEVLLAGLAEFGRGFLSRLNGMFMIALWDRLERELLLARDPIGVKPLYYAEPSKGVLVFGSEIKALCAYSKLERRPDFVALQQHLAYCHASADRTSLDGVKRLRPGHSLVWKAGNGSIKIERFWKTPFDLPQAVSRNRAVEMLRSRLLDAVDRQLVSDVPVGAFLSGGLDSSLITAIASERAKSRFECFVATWPENENRLDQTDSDLPYARMIAGKLGVHLNEIQVRHEISDVLPKLIYHLDEPLVDPAILTCFQICRDARARGVPVLLSGQGGDELFCGYPRYLVMHATQWLEKVPLSMRRGAATMARLLPSAREGAFGAFMRRVRKAGSGLELEPSSRFLDMCSTTPEAEFRKVMSPEFRAAVSNESFQDECLAHMRARGLDGLQVLQDRDLEIYLPNHNLLYTDKIAMAFGLEVRVPLLDLEIVDEVLRYPYGWQLAGLHTKSLFRDAAADFVPREILRRRKSGFGAPYRKWLRYDLIDMWETITSERATRERGWFDNVAVQEARKRSQSGSADLYMLQWAVITIELWARQFLDVNPSETRVTSW